MTKIVDINPHMPMVRGMLENPRAYWEKEAAEMRAIAQQLRDSSDPRISQQEIMKLADKADSIADHLDNIAKKARSRKAKAQ
jgi:hypothetical protein